MMAKAKEDAPQFPFTPEQLAAQLRDLMLAHVQNLRVQWDSLPEAEQKAYIGNIERDAVGVIEGCIEAILADGDATVIDVTANDIVEKSESLQIKVNALKKADVCKALAGKAHKPMKLVFMGNRDRVLDTGETPNPDPDQPKMFKDDDEVMQEASTGRRRRSTKLKLAET